MAATERRWRRLAAVLLVLAAPVTATVLPDERVDILYHSYEGGGTTIDGPSVLVRKNLGSSVSVSGKYYVDAISGASLDVRAAGVTTDVESGASVYSEKRTEYNLGIDYLHDRTLLSAGWARSSENDYEARSWSLGVSQTFFGDLSTLALNVSFGDDVITRNDDPDFDAREMQRRRYGLTFTQVLTPRLIAALSVETALDEGFINNPYRSVRYCADLECSQFNYQSEVYPGTRNSDAFGLRAIYYLPYRAALRGEYRYFEDNWGVSAHNGELRYTHPFDPGWLVEVKYRQYRQSGANFFQDLFPYRDAQNYMARDKEMGPFSSHTVGLGTSYQLPQGFVPGFSRSSVNLYWDYILFDYDDFRDVTAEGYAVGEEPLYSFSANVIRLYLSFWF
ncbi:DUF3570 domain-containing protein [Marinimicrobium alkaliphilum]|uniref:DUF3570 domain-containing protein n=1 Tax=Marinimicrobium alkaliphilum TaxID=2202654 RepID=UPI001E5C7469|nr:DUF3570 domain-containing protein [Marinimicrobium alkaliphilum]